MDKNVKVLIVLGAAGVGVYILYKGGYLAQWFPSVFGPSTAPATIPGTTPTTPTPSTATTSTPPSNTAPPTQQQTPPPPPVPTAQQRPAVGSTTTDSSGNVFSWSGSAWTLQTCGGGLTNVNGVCTALIYTPTPAPPIVPTLLVSQQVLQAAQAAGEPNDLNMDQWNYYYQQLTGQQVNLPPIDPGVYIGAGVQPNADGSGPDNTSPMPLSTWLAIMQQVMPQLGLTGLGNISDLGAGAGRYNHWLT